MHLIWSIEHDAWWKQNKHGYTKNISDAGRFLQAEAFDIIQEANRIRVEDCMIPVDCIETLNI